MITLYKYTMNIDGSTYKALFTDHFDADEFINECINYDNSTVTVIQYERITTPQAVWEDNDIERDYAVEMIAMMIEYPTPNQRINQIEQHLKRIGVIK